jgi:hypothetical protein
MAQASKYFPLIVLSQLTNEASGEVCEGEGDHYGVKVFPKAGVALNADVAKADDPEDPLAEAVIAVS